MNLVRLAEKFGLHSEEVHRKQEVLARSLNLRIMAVENLLESSGSKTPGVDRVSISRKCHSENKIKLVEWLKQQISSPSSYKSLPVKRVFIPKSNGKQRPLGIPTIQDRALQSLINLILLPLVEFTSDHQSYGYRPFRSAKHAIGAVRQNLLTGLEDR
jgi:RNA-directed DNA polymerase